MTVKGINTVKTFVSGRGQREGMIEGVRSLTSGRGGIQSPGGVIIKGEGGRKGSADMVKAGEVAGS